MWMPVSVRAPMDPGEYRWMLRRVLQVLVMGEELGDPVRRWMEEHCDVRDDASVRQLTRVQSAVRKAAFVQHGLQAQL